MRMWGRTSSAASTRSSLGSLFRFAPAIAGSSSSPRLQPAGTVIGLIVSCGRSRYQVHGTDKDQDQSDGDEQAGDQPRDGTGSCPSPVVPERRDEDTTARPEGCGPEGNQPPPSLRY